MTIHIPWWLVGLLLGALSLAALFGSVLAIEPVLMPIRDSGRIGVFAILATVSWALAVGMGAAYVWSIKGD